MAFTELKRVNGQPIWINEYGLVLREPHETEWHHGGPYKGEVTVVGGYIVRGAPEEVAQTIDGNDFRTPLHWGTTL